MSGADGGAAERGKGEPDLSIVIPVFDEADRIGATVATVESWLRSRREAGSLRSAEIVVVSDGSRDDPERSLEIGVRDGVALTFIALPENRGKGAAVRIGVLASRGARVLFSDADLATPIEYAARLEAALADGAAVAIGSRRVADSDVQVAQSPLRRLSGGIFPRLVRLFTGLPYADTQCGFKMFRGDIARALFEPLREERFAFDVELLCAARERGLEVAEVGVVWRDSGESTVRIWRDSLRMLRALTRFADRRRFPAVFRRQVGLALSAGSVLVAVVLALVWFLS